MDRYADFWHVTQDALRSAVQQLSIGATDRQLESLMQAYLVPRAFPEVAFALEAVRGLPLAILSNGSPAMLDSAVEVFPDGRTGEQWRLFKPGTEAPHVVMEDGILRKDEAEEKIPAETKIKSIWVH
jgi:2-haloacid dehalogenase